MTNDAQAKLQAQYDRAFLLEELRRERDAKEAAWVEVKALHQQLVAPEGLRERLQQLAEEIMNIPSKGEINEGIGRFAYQRGHRDARHAASERLLAAIPVSSPRPTGEER